jgi:hypothetical protein
LILFSIFVEVWIIAGHLSVTRLQGVDLGVKEYEEFVVLHQKRNNDKSQKIYYSISFWAGKRRSLCNGHLIGVHVNT